MTILLTKALHVGGVLLASGTTQTFAADLEADIVARQGATYLTDPTPGKTVPVVATTNLTGVVINTIVNCTQVEYDALTPDDNTLYVIVG